MLIGLAAAAAAAVSSGPFVGFLESGRPGISYNKGGAPAAAAAGGAVVGAMSLLGQRLTD